MIPQRFILGGIVGAAALSILFVRPIPAQAPYIQIPSDQTALTDVRSSTFIQAEKDALALWKEGRRGEAKAAMYRESTDAAPPDAAAAKVRLGYMNLSDKNEAEATRLFESVADMPSGVNDAARKEAAERLGYLAIRHKDYDLARARFQRLLSGEYRISHADAVEVCRRLGQLEHRLNNLQEAVPYFQALADQLEDPAASAGGLTSLAGLWIELGKGEGKRPIPPEERAAAFDQARAICQGVMAQGAPESANPAPEDRVMVAELMHFESYYFQGDYETSWQLGDEFLSRWGTDPSRYENANMKIYVNTARTFQVMDAYITGRFEESLALAEELAANLPPPSERFKDLDATMYTYVCGTVASQALERPTDAARFESLGKAYNTRHYDLLYPAIAQRSSNYVAAKKTQSLSKEVAQKAL